MSWTRDHFWPNLLLFKQKGPFAGFFHERTGTFEADKTVSVDQKSFCGTTLRKIIEFALPRGWFPEITPGTVQ